MYVYIKHFNVPILQYTDDKTIANAARAKECRVDMIG
jgi:hypothetical protein